MRDPRPFDGGEPDPEQELQAQDGGDIRSLAGKLMGLCFLVVAAICVFLGKLRKMM